MTSRSNRIDGFFKHAGLAILLCIAGSFLFQVQAGEFALTSQLKQSSAYKSPTLEDDMEKTASNIGIVKQATNGIASAGNGWK
jgi:hypothetical protein